MARLGIDDLIAQYGPLPLRALDEHGNQILYVTWIDPAEETFGQLVVDENGKPQLDPSDPTKAWEITRYGWLRIEKR